MLYGEIISRVFALTLKDEIIGVDSPVHFRCHEAGARNLHEEEHLIEDCRWLVL